jgi:glycosyltransferase involved in cell wall biosynthesis
MPAGEGSQMPNVPGISIVVPSFNQGTYIGKMIDSVLTQTHQEFELIIMDGGSTDETVEILKRYEIDPRIIWRSERDDGPVDAVNNGLKVAKYSIGTIISTDDYFLPGAFAEAVEVFQAHQGLSLVYGEYAKLLDSGELETVSTDDYSLCDLMRGTTSVPQGAAFFDVEHARRLGGWDQRIPYVPDTDLWFRLALTGTVVKCKRTWLGSHVHADQRTNQRARVIRDYTLMLAQMKELAAAPRQARSAARAGLYLAQTKYGDVSDLNATLLLWKAICLSPGLFGSGQISLHRLVPGYFRMTSLFLRIRQALGLKAKASS